MQANFLFVGSFKSANQKVRIDDVLSVYAVFEAKVDPLWFTLPWLELEPVQRS